jgi:hypothetical protein
VPTVEVAQQVGFTVLFPITFVSNVFVATSTLPSWLQPFAEWNPTSTLTASLRELWGNPSPATTFPFKYDATDPTVGNPLPARPPDRAGWYNRPVGFAVQGTDAMSGIDACPPQSYTGPDSAAASFAGT